MGCHLQTESHQAPDVVSKHNYALDTQYYGHWQQLCPADYRIFQCISRPFKSEESFPKNRC